MKLLTSLIPLLIFGAIAISATPAPPVAGPKEGTYYYQSEVMPNGERSETWFEVRITLKKAANGAFAVTGEASEIEPMSVSRRAGVVLKTKVSGTMSKSGVLRANAYQGTNKNESRPINGKWDDKEGGILFEAVEGSPIQSEAVAINEKEIANFTGLWNTTEASRMELKQSGLTVYGTYNYAGGKIKGQVTGRVLKFEWDQTNERAGTGKFTMDKSNESFTGSWVYTKPASQAGQGKSWNGTKTKE